MVDGPHQAADHAHAGEADDLVQFGNEKTAPADFFAKGTRSFSDKANRCSEKDEQREDDSRREIRPAELRGGALDKISGKKAAERREPRDKINRQRVGERDQIREPRVTRAAPSPR